jgi:membrane associated rhomboid family serine protease
MAQALARERLGFRRFPLVTAVVFTVTAVTSVLGLVFPRVLEALERTPQGLHGDWWRTLTSLFVQDGGVLGTLSNLLFLLLLGVLAERLAGPGWWVAAYFGAGLAGLLVVALLAGTRLPRLAPMAVLWWCGALLSIRWGTVPLLAGIAGAGAVQLIPERWAVLAGRLAAVAAAAAAVALLAAADIHGAALTAGILLAAATRPFWRRTAAA